MHAMPVLMTAKPIQQAGRSYVKVRLGKIPQFTLSEHDACEFASALSGFSAAPIHTNLNIELIIEDVGEEMVIKMQGWKEVLTRADASRLKALVLPR